MPSHLRSVCCYHTINFYYNDDEMKLQFKCLLRDKFSEVEENTYAAAAWILSVFSDDAQWEEGKLSVASFQTYSTPFFPFQDGPLWLVTVATRPKVSCCITC